MIVSALSLTACTDKDYDFDNVDSTVGVGGNELNIPGGSTEVIQLSEILELEDNGSVVEDEAGNYVFRSTGDDVAAVHPYVEKIVVSEKSKETYPVTLNVTTANKAKGRQSDAQAGLSADGDIVNFKYDGKQPAEVEELQSATTSSKITLDVKFPQGLSQYVSEFSDITLSFPEYMTIKAIQCSTTPVLNANKLVFNNVKTNAPLKVVVEVTTLNFNTKATGSNFLKMADGKISMNGYIHLSANAALKSAPASALGNVTATVNMEKFEISGARGRFNPSINLNTLGDVKITGVPDFLKGGNVVVDLYNPQILLSIDNDMELDGTIDGVITAIKDGKEIASVNVNGIPIDANTKTTVCICRRKENVSGYTHVMAVPELSNIIRTIPDRLKFTAKAKANASKVVDFKLGHNYTVKPAYSVDSPIAFASDATIEYRDTIDGWNDDVKKLRLADDAYILLTGTVTNCVPAYLTVKALPVDINGNVIDDVTIDVPTIVAASNGTDPVSTPLEVKLSQKPGADLKRLDGIALIVSGKADGEKGAVTGVVLNARKHTLKIDGIKIRVIGKVIADMN